MTAPIHNVKAELHRPIAALRRLQDLSGQIKSAANDRNANRAAQLDSISTEMFNICVAALGGGPLPKPVNHKEAI